MNFLWVSKKTSKKTSKMKLSVGVQEESPRREPVGVQEETLQEETPSVGVQEENPVGVQEDVQDEAICGCPRRESSGSTNYQEEIHLWVSKKRISKKRTEKCGCPRRICGCPRYSDIPHLWVSKMNFLWVSKKTSKKTSKMKLSVGVQEENLQEENQWVSKKRLPRRAICGCPRREKRIIGLNCRPVLPLWRLR